MLQGFGWSSILPYKLTNDPFCYLPSEGGSVSTLLGVQGALFI